MHANDLTFGVEIECYHRSTSFEATRTILRDAGIRVGSSENYGARNTGTEWLVKRDGSLSTHAGRGREIVSPVLQGDAGIETLRTAATALQNDRHFADGTCGVHVHIGTSNMTPKQVATIWARYNMLGDEICDTLHPSRKRAFYASLVNAASVPTKLANVTDTTQMYMLHHALGEQERRRAVNVTRCGASPATRTIEFRQHQGTTDPERIVMWVRFLRDFIIETLRKMEAPTQTLANPFTKPTSQHAVLWNAFASGRTLTAAEAATLIGTTEQRAIWQIGTMRKRAAARDAAPDMVVRRGRRGGATTYAFAMAGTGAMTWGTMLDGVDQEVAAHRAARRAFYAARAAA
jgi:hypothetical protein